MCTLTTKKRLSIAIKPVKCYKILHAFGDAFRHTPLQQTRISAECFSEKHEERKAFKADGDIELLDTETWTLHYFGEEYKYSAEKGFIHCFKNTEDAIMAAKEYLSASGYEHTEVWEVEVPFGTRYVEGINAWSDEAQHPLDMLPAIAAKKIVFKKCVATYYNIEIKE